MRSFAHVDLLTGRVDGALTGRKLLGDIAGLFHAESDLPRETVVYETYGCASPDTEEPELLWGTTVLYPGLVGDEFFMTRGHFHVNPLRGETCLTLAGSGALLLMGRDRSLSFEPMSPGSMHLIDGSLAHRVVNTGSVPLVFYVTWLADCGHDYESIEREGFSRRMVVGTDGPELA